MQTGIAPASKTRKRMTILAAITGSTVIIALAIAFVAVDFNALMIAPSFTVSDNTIEALEPIRSDPESEPNGSTGNNGDDGTGNGNGAGNIDNANDDDSDNDSDNYPDHGLPCLDPNCPIHHGGTHEIPCGDPNCPICNHEQPCGDPNCPICNHETPCDDPNCPICHPGEDKPPVEIPMEIVNFKPNSYEYVDKDAALKALSGYVDSFNRYFERYPDSKIYLVGCIAKTANWSLTETELSQQRADAVKQSLIELGIGGDKLVALGIGISDPWRNDEWADGNFNEDVAKLNRRVWIVPDMYDEHIGIILATDELIDKLKEE